MANYFIQTYTYNPWENLAAEKYLAGQIKKGDVILYLWQNENTVVIGRNQNAIRECRARLLEEEGGYLARRTTGGGAVYQDLGNLCFTFLASPEVYDLEKQLKLIRLACRKFGIETAFSGRNDIITADGFKFSGNAFSKTAACHIQHGTLMVDVDVTKLGRYLTPSKEKMKAKGVKSVQSRVCNLRELNPAVTTDAMRQALKESFAEMYGEFTELDPGILENEEVKETYDLYASWDWKFGKSPECETVYRKRFDWGEAEVHLKLHAMHICGIKVYSDALDVELPRLAEEFLLGKRYDMADADVEEFCGKMWAQRCGADEKDIQKEEQEGKLREIVEWLSSIRE